MENKQTAVEYFAGVIASILMSVDRNIAAETASLLHEAELQANEMFQKQIEEAYNAGVKFATEWVLNKVPNLQKPSDYFTKTYNNGKDS